MTYDEKTIQQVWDHGRALSDRDSNEWRQDQCGAWIKRESYGQDLSEFGWSIHSILPGSNDVENLRPFHHQNVCNGSSGNVKCHITADRTAVSPTAYIDHPHNKPA